MIALEKGVNPPTDLSKTAKHIISWQASPAPLRIEGFRLIFLSQIWHQNLELPRFDVGLEPALVVSRWGWHEGNWFDGPLCRLDPEGKVVSMLPLGEVGRLFVDENTLRSGGELDAAPGANIRQSLIWAVRTKLGANTEPLQINLEGSAVVDALYLTLLRMAYLKRRIVVGTLPAKQPERWKRLMQNLGIEFQRQKKLDANFSLDQVAGLVPEEKMGLVLKELNRLSAVVPPSLFS
ncbi:MAG: hypothetical protein AB7T49_05205 [Oligoflexales bacterium]